MITINVTDIADKSKICKESIKQWAKDNKKLILSGSVLVGGLIIRSILKKEGVSGVGISLDFDVYRHQRKTNEPRVVSNIHIANSNLKLKDLGKLGNLLVNYSNGTLTKDDPLGHVSISTSYEKDESQKRFWF